ncbi:unnamed protein product [Gadus morhua 'NCC']
MAGAGGFECVQRWQHEGNEREASPGGYSGSSWSPGCGGEYICMQSLCKGDTERHTASEEGSRQKCRL